ncbi:hypothetical protein ALC62_08240 [Cyphomyrmex costatus]|uniref:Uncharacterized protein n=1 Tax=Cyphomyrmex costatus TaxID=456900 RepID=A0A195CLR7_9HYME|nr:hypothetical protein ALC62_08240 [Cyphomyrmex costatus]
MPRDARSIDQVALKGVGLTREIKYSHRYRSSSRFISASYFLSLEFLVSTSSSSSSLSLGDIVFNMIGVVRLGNIEPYLRKPLSNRRSRVSIHSPPLCNYSVVLRKIKTSNFYRRVAVEI